MILKTTQLQGGKIVFMDEHGKTFYTLQDSPPICKGSSTEFAREIVSEAMRLNMVMNNPTESGCGWSGNFIQKLEHRKLELQQALMKLCIDEAITLSIEEKTNAG